MLGTRFQKKIGKTDSAAGYQEDKYSQLYCAAHVELELCLCQSAPAAMELELLCGGLSCIGGGCGSTDLAELTPWCLADWMGVTSRQHAQVLGLVSSVSPSSCGVLETPTKQANDTAAEGGTDMLDQKVGHRF